MDNMMTNGDVDRMKVRTFMGQIARVADALKITPDEMELAAVTLLGMADGVRERIFARKDLAKAEAPKAVTH